ncbi:MAG: spore coat associated protein CotJA [Lachnospiraceae bacterium]
MNTSYKRSCQNKMNTDCRPPMKPEPRNRNNDNNYCRINMGNRNRPYEKPMDCKCKPPYEKPMPPMDCKCKTPYEKQCHKHDDMEKLGCDFPPVMSYVPWQQWGDLYEPECALREGTIFKELNYIFCGVRC